MDKIWSGVTKLTKTNDLNYLIYPTFNNDRLFGLPFEEWQALLASFIGMLRDDNGATMFFIIEKSEKTTFSFSQDCMSII